MKAACPQGPAASSLDYVLDTGAFSKSGPPSNILKQIIISSISSMNTITVTVVITQAFGYRQQFLYNTATKRHLRNTTNPNALLKPASQLVQALKNEKKPSVESEGASQALCKPPPFPSDPIRNQLPQNSMISLKATRQQVCQESSI